MLAPAFQPPSQAAQRLWQSRYRATVIDSQQYFEQVVAYVHLNPVAARIAKDPAAYQQSGHRSVLGLCRPRLIDIDALLEGFGGHPWNRSRERYLECLRGLADARWLAEGIERLPWWVGARSVEEIANPVRHAGATTYDGQALADIRRPLDLEEIVQGFEANSRQAVLELASRRRSLGVIRGRIELTLLAVDRYGRRCSDIARLLHKDLSSVSRWLNNGLRLEQEDTAFRHRIDTLDRALSEPTHDNALMQRVAP